jgi:uncharacterized protein YjiK
VWKLIKNIALAFDEFENYFEYYRNNNYCIFKDPNRKKKVVAEKLKKPAVVKKVKEPKIKEEKLEKAEKFDRNLDSSIGT